MKFIDESNDIHVPTFITLKRPSSCIGYNYILGILGVPREHCIFDQYYVTLLWFIQRRFSVGKIKYISFTSELNYFEQYANISTLLFIFSSDFMLELMEQKLSLSRIRSNP